MTEALQATIEKAWDERDGITIGTGGEVRAAVVEALARDYLGICIWGAPATIALYSLTGWLVGLELHDALLWRRVLVILASVSTQARVSFFKKNRLTAPEAARSWALEVAPTRVLKPSNNTSVPPM